MAKRIIGLIVLLLSLNVAAANARADVIDRVLARATVGGKLGIGMATFSGDDVDNGIVTYTGKRGMAGGGFVHVGVHELFAVQAELLIASRGVRYAIMRGSGGTLDLRYIDLPILVRVAYPRARLVTPYLLAGARASLLIDAQVEDDTGATAGYEDETSTLDLGLVVGLGAALALPSPGALFIEARFEQGLRSIDARESDDDLDNRTLFVMFGYQR